MVMVSEQLGQVAAHMRAIVQDPYGDAAMLRHDRKPVSLSFEQAAVVPISAGTPLQALTDQGRIEAGQQVLVIGASGGVGSTI
jgi:NADPH:quinone reductase-like Zn-dependent oxidoreductase